MAHACRECDTLRLADLKASIPCTIELDWWFSLVSHVPATAENLDANFILRRPVEFWRGGQIPRDETPVVCFSARGA